MPKLYNNETGDFIGEITEEQLLFLKNELEEESLEDRDYAIEPMTLAFFQEEGIDQTLLALLRKALGSQDQIMIRWE